MELVSRMMDGSIPQPPEAGPGLSDTPARLRQDDKMTYLQRVQLFESCSSRQLRAIARSPLRFAADTSYLRVARELLGKLNPR